MIDPAESIQEALANQLRAGDFDAVDVMPIPAGSDRMVRLRTLEEALDEEMIGYLVQVKLRQAIVPQLKMDSTAKPSIENMYLPNGQLNISFLLKNADLLYDSGDFALARNIYRALQQSAEKTPTALYGIARCYEAENKLEEARIHYEESIAYHPSAIAFHRLAALLIQQKKDQQAAEVMERALSLKDLPIETRFELHKASGNCWTRVRRVQEAERHYQKALEIQPAADEIRANLGALFLQSNRVSEARRHFQDAIASNPRNDKALCGLGSCALAEGEKRLAYDYFAQALDTELNNPNAVFYLVKCAYELRSYATAARILEEYVQIAPVNINLLYSLAGLQFHLGRMEDAQATVRKILELLPEHSGAIELSKMIERFVSKKMSH